IPVGEKDGELITGFYQKRSHRIIDDMDTCIIQDEVNDDMVDVVREIATKLGITAYDEKKDRGTLRHIVVRTGERTGETMVVLITRSKKLPYQQQLIDEITKHHPHVKSIVHNINKQQTNVIFGNKTKVIWCEPYIRDTIGNITFCTSARSFYQVSPKQTDVLYEKALEYAQLEPDDVVVDEYCGMGRISSLLAQKAKKV